MSRREKCRYCGGGAVDLTGHEENCVMRTGQQPGRLHRPNVTPIVVGMDIAERGVLDATVLTIGTRVVLGAGGGGPAVIDRDWINGLNAGRKPERDQLALAFDTIARAHGAKVERRDEPPNPGYHGASIGLRIALNGVGAMLNVDSLHGGACALIHWHNDYGEGRRECRDLSSHFAVAVRASSGRSPHKATTCCDDWYALALCLDAGLLLASRGEAFEKPSAT